MQSWMQWQIRGNVLKTKVAYFGALTALGLIFSYIEALIPIHLGIPGAKLGLANLVIVVALYKMSVRECYLLSLARVMLSGFLFGNLFGILYSLAGGLFSLTVMAILKRTEKFSIIGVSIAGGVFHNVGQLIMAVVVLWSLSMVYYLPMLLIAGIVTGLLIGLAAREVLKRDGVWRV